MKSCSFDWSRHNQCVKCESHRYLKKNKKREQNQCCAFNSIQS